MVRKQISSTNILLDEMKLKSDVMKDHLEKMFKAHVQRTLLGERMGKGLSSKNQKYYKNFKSDKEKLLLLLNEQLQEVSFVLSDIRSINNLLELLVATEQISLELENQKSKSDASRLINPELTPLKKYAYDVDQVKILEDSFEVLRIELERQRSMLNNQVLPLEYSEVQVDEDYGNNISFQGSVNVQNLRSFCDTLNKRLVQHILSSHNSINSSDIETMKMIEELKQIKLDPSVFFSPSIHDLLSRISRKRILDRGYEKIVFYNIIFLMSRLKKYYPHEYYRRIRLLLLVNDVASEANLTDAQTDFACISIIIESFDKFKLLDKKLSIEENRILSSYNDSSKKIILEQLPHSNLMDYVENEFWKVRAKELCLLAIQVDSAYRTVYSEKKNVSYADIIGYLKIEYDDFKKISMTMVSRYEFLINPKGHFMSQYFLEPILDKNEKNYKGKNKKKVKTSKRTGMKR